VVNRQDWAACESVQRNTASPGWRPGPLSRWETDVHTVMATVARGYTTGHLGRVQTPA
jgi:Rieske 2Fe-2S family protein